MAESAEKKFNFEEHIPEGYVKTVVVGEGYTAEVYRNPNPDPVEREQGLRDVAEILMIGYRRALLREQAAEQT